MTKQMRQISDSSGIDIILEEKNVKVSDEKLKSMLSEAYEAAQCKSDEFRFSKLWNVFLSISGTLLLSIFTASFNEIGYLSANEVRNLVFFVCTVFGILGFVLLICRSNRTIKNRVSERNDAVDMIMSNHKIKVIVFDE